MTEIDGEVLENNLLSNFIIYFNCCLIFPWTWYGGHLSRSELINAEVPAAFVRMAFA